MRIVRVVPQLRTTNLEESIAFYTAKLGLELEFRFEGFYAGIRAGNQVFHLKQVCERDPSIEYVEHEGHFHLYLQTDDVLRAADLLKAMGVALMRDVHETEWSTREFVIKDSQGHIIYFGEPLS